jgi:hypothetical protein
MAARTTGFLEGAVSRIAIEALKALILRLNGPTIIAAALLIPTPNAGGVVDDDVPGLMGVRFHLDGQARTLKFTVTDDDGRKAYAYCSITDGRFVDEKGRPVGRYLPDVGVYFDHDALIATLQDKLNADARLKTSTRSDDPKLCPAPSPDQPGGRKIFDLAYADYVNEEIVNKGFPPLPPGMAFSLFNPISGRDVHFDGCRYTTGDPQEYKGHYGDLVANPFFTDDKLKDDFLDQAEKQIEANTARNLLAGRINTIEWHFDEGKPQILLGKYSRKKVTWEKV